MFLDFIFPTIEELIGRTNVKQRYIYKKCVFCEKPFRTQNKKEIDCRSNLCVGLTIVKEINLAISTRNSVLTKLKDPGTVHTPIEKLLDLKGMLNHRIKSLLDRYEKLFKVKL